jgi:hypothetical protein
MSDPEKKQPRQQQPPLSPVQPSVCKFQLAVPFNYNSNTKVYAFGDNSVQLCQKRQDGSYDCAPPSGGMGGLGAPQGMYCAQSNISTHMNCFSSELECLTTVAALNGIDENTQGPYN